MVGLFATVGISIGGIAWQSSENKRKIERFKKIFNTLENESKVYYTPSSLSTNTVSTVRPISLEMENEILERLEAFEKKNRFLSNDILASSMASLLKTTTKNLSYILKTYRDADFNRYINAM